jgi:putative transport protein
MPSPRRLVVLTPEGVGKELSEISLPQRFQCIVTGIQRGEVFFEPTADIMIHRGDVLYVVGRREHVRDAAEALGRLERPTAETDIAVYAGGIFLGLMLAQVAIPLGTFTLTLGVAGGLLLMGLLLGRFRRIGPLRTHVPLAARQLVRDLGILLFVAETGVRAGRYSFEPMEAVLGPAIVAGILTMAIPVVLTVLVARTMFRQMPAVHVWGSIGGGMTSSASLVAIRNAADSDEPAIPYAAAYAVASVFVTMAGQLVVWMMR